jgi:hypothetical protein
LAGGFVDRFEGRARREKGEASRFLFRTVFSDSKQPQ